MKLAAMPKCFMDAMGIDRTMSVFEWIEIARNHLRPLGVTGLEMHPGFLESLEETYLIRLRKSAEDAGFTLPMFCASPDFTHPDPAERTEAVERHRRMIRTAATLGSGFCRVLSGQRRPEVSEEEGIRYTVECITALLPEAERLGVILNMENHFKDHYWTLPEFAQKQARFLAIVERIDSPFFGVNFDPSNTLLAGEDYMELLEKVKHRVVTMHASDRRPRAGVTAGTESLTDYTQLIHGEIGTGIIDYDRIFAVLKAIGFDGWISIEDGESGIEELERSARFLVRKGSEFLN
ncbi:MAG: sugar phosphate isomerase/epimerase family protein [Capsulimonadales bacterium]|nr:sugar phosphate isomerase/epimerase family protein [Capsulimonadales bacterium]